MHRIEKYPINGFTLIVRLNCIVELNPFRNVNIPVELLIEKYTSKSTMKIVSSKEYPSISYST